MQQYQNVLYPDSISFILILPPLTESAYVKFNFS